MANVSLPPQFANIPRVQLLFPHASAIEPLTNLTKHVQSWNPTAKLADLWIKREDCNSGLALGGNKLRKLEYVIADALAQGCDTLVTTGGLQSNHMRQTVAAGNRYGLKTVLVPTDRVSGRGPEYYVAGNVQLDHLLGATVLPAGNVMEEVSSMLQQDGKKPYLIPSGASTHPLGSLGYAGCAFEIIAQEKEMNIFFDTIVVAIASGSTLAGLVAGFQLAREHGIDTNASPRDLIGVDVFAAEQSEQLRQFQSIVKTAEEKIGVKENVTSESYRIDRRFNAGTYGFVDETTAKAVKLLAQHEGILTDPVYTGKAVAGMIKMAQGDLHNAKNVLFVHTGGQAALSAYGSLR